MSVTRTTVSAFFSSDTATSSTIKASAAYISAVSAVLSNTITPSTMPSGSASAVSAI